MLYTSADFQVSDAAQALCNGSLQRRSLTALQRLSNGPLAAVLQRLSGVQHWSYEGDLYTWGSE
jgi:hypothetical protein